MAEHLGLHPTDLQSVSLLALEPGPRTTGEIAEVTGLTSGSATRLVDRLQKAGLAERHPDAHDRRKMLVSLTSGRTPGRGRLGHPAEGFRPGPGRLHRRGTHRDRAVPALYHRRRHRTDRTSARQLISTTARLPHAARFAPGNQPLTVTGLQKTNVF
ncbi:MarR family winged helix-turn-helix transcriptional regulator [Streptomyces sp. ISL-98]|uniref:MarR family winged helix-turn-helix transcriptional regulator n=1 Tax=Streptomyces sp. ISL-98 TaxID=2819192 RepID=UPI002034F5FA|nr:MarR family winged helix-turn-helix transcriptional regulator [Streptomyces sp. ISL-98]